MTKPTRYRVSVSRNGAKRATHRRRMKGVVVDDPSAGIPGYDEPLDSEWLDPDPDFRTTLRLLNAAGVHTVSSCQGHAPGAQYDHVQEWMEAYITCRMAAAEGIRLACGLLQSIGGEILSVSEGKIYASFPRSWEWKKSVDVLKKLR